MYSLSNYPCSCDQVCSAFPAIFDFRKLESFENVSTHKAHKACNSPFGNFCVFKRQRFGGNNGAQSPPKQSNAWHLKKTKQNISYKNMD